MRIGIGYDSHRFAEGRKLIIGGVEIPFDKGLLGHSDADVLCHAIIDAVIGAIGLGDIGKLFPDTDPEWRDAVSVELLKYIVDLARMNGYAIAWIDTTIITERPKLAPYIEEMKTAIARTGIPLGLINIKAKTNEGMGFIGRGEGIAVQAVCLLSRI
ncbi:MAG TPA: 2-C-methyl-D-erythritol 2,4-cyclodiphosphate synthase [Nitrospirota bacterium]|nr:2-C-methyl-D-erythritol 2,4-cyclodiphosphate synthase [Nitrospirota bacterium]